MKIFMVKKNLVGLAIAAAATVMGVMPAFAAGWTFDGPEDYKWRYEDETGVRLVSTFKTIDGKLYHFDSNGYLDLALDDGAWFNIDGNRYYILHSGEIVTNSTTDTGYVDEVGTFRTYKMNEGLAIAPDEDYAYWNQKVIQYGYNNVIGEHTVNSSGQGVTRYTFVMPENLAAPGQGVPTFSDYIEVGKARVNQDTADKENWSGIWYTNGNMLVYEVDDVWGTSYGYTGM